MNLTDRLNAIRGALHAPVPRIRDALREVDEIEARFAIKTPVPAEVPSIEAPGIVVGMDLSDAGIDKAEKVVAAAAKKDEKTKI